MAVSKVDLTPRGQIYLGGIHGPGETFEVIGVRRLANLGQVSEKDYVALKEYHDSGDDAERYYVSDGNQWQKTDEAAYSKAIKDYQAEWKKKLKAEARAEAESKKAAAENAAKEAEKKKQEAAKHEETHEQPAPAEGQKG